MCVPRGRLNLMSTALARRICAARCVRRALVRYS